MPFTAKPLVGGDAFDLACRVAQEADQELALLADPGEQAACIARHWNAITELGWLATAIPEEEGGIGGSLSDLAALACGVGRGGLPLPIAGACAVAPHLLSAAGPGRGDLLARISSGEARIALILPDAAQEGEGLRLAQSGDGFMLDGSVVGVEIPPDPTHLLLVLTGADPVMLLLPARAEGIELAVYQRIDGRLAGDWRFTSPAVDASAVLARGGEVARVAEEARDLGALLTCVEGVSAMGALIEQTITYLSSRVQFGAPLSSYQALRHRVAEMYVEYENLRALVQHALRAAEEEGRIAWRDVAFAKLRLGEAGRFIAHSSIQCHGGMGMTEEVPAIRLARRIMMAEFEYGDRVFHARRLLAADGRAAA